MRYAVIDTETSALIQNSLQPLSKQPHVIELFALALDEEWNEVETFAHYIDPGIVLPPEVTKITGITPEMLVGKPSFIDIAHLWEEFISGIDVVVAHNLSYDKAIIDFEFRRIDRKSRWPLRGICTVEATESLKGHRLNLSALHELLFGEGFEKAHSAEADVRATARCFRELVKRGEV